MPDPRGRKGRIHPFTALVCAVAAAVLTGAKSPAAIGEWITDAPPWAPRTLDFTPDPFTGQISAPHPATVHRLLERLDGDALDRAVAAFLDTRSATSVTVDEPTARAIRRAVPVDGKTVRGPRTAERNAVFLLAATDHSGNVPAQRQIADKSNELPAFAPPLDSIEDPENTVITADAPHTQHAHGAYLRERGAHHRIEIRRLKAAAFDRIDHPDAKQALQIVRWRMDRSTGQLSIERVHLITSLAPGTELASWIKGHRGIENLPHHVRDRTFREDDSKIRTGHLPRTTASLRTLAVGVHRQNGQTNMAAALRQAARDYRRPLTALGLT
ncbi:transposase family protein [Streptomyces sp. ZYX-F-203]